MVFVFLYYKNVLNSILEDKCMNKERFLRFGKCRFLFNYLFIMVQSLCRNVTYDFE